jgi:hypothetical protein
VHTVQRDIHKARNAPFYHHRAAHQVTHQAADGREVESDTSEPWSL